MARLFSLYGFLVVPDFPAAVLLRGLRRAPALAVSTGKAPNQFVYAANEAARRGGALPGMPLPEAVARFSHAGGEALRVEERNPEAEEQAQRALLELALSVSPRFEDAAPGLIVIDLAGLPDPHHSVTLLSYGAEKLGLEANLGVSHNRFVALSAARTRPGVTHVFPGEDAGFLAQLLLEVLPLDDKEKKTFERWGLRTVGDLAKLSQDALTERFGARGATLARLARGEQESLLRPWEPPPELEEKQDFDWQIGEIEPLAFLLSGMIETLCLKLQAHNLAAAGLVLRLKLANGARFERTLPLGHPLADPRTLLTLVRLDLEAHPPGEAIEGVSIGAQPTPRRMVQYALFDPALPSPEKLAVTLARLANLVGPERVGTPLVPNTHRPGAFAVGEWVFQGQARDKGRARDKGQIRDKGQGTRDKILLVAPVEVGGLPAVPARYVDKKVNSRGGTPPPLQVVSTGRPDGSPPLVPLKIISRGHKLKGERSSPSSLVPCPLSLVPGLLSRSSLAFRSFRPSLPAEVNARGGAPVFVDCAEVRGAVETCAGPWRVRGEWWISEGWQYEEWDLQIEGRLYRLCRDQQSGSWHLTGAYD